MGQWVNSMGQFNGSMNQWINESMGQWVNGSMNRWVEGLMGWWVDGCGSTMGRLWDDGTIMGRWDNWSCW